MGANGALQGIQHGSGAIARNAPDPAPGGVGWPPLRPEAAGVNWAMFAQQVGSNGGGGTGGGVE